MKPLIDEVRESDGAVLNREGTAAVFVRAGADVEAIFDVGRDQLGLPARDGTVDEGPSLLLRLGLGPVDRVVVERDLIEPEIPLASTGATSRTRAT